MAVTYRSAQATSTSGEDGSGQVELDVQMPPSIGNGDTLVCVVFQDNDGDIAELGQPSGWIQAGDDIPNLDPSPFGKIWTFSDALASMAGDVVTWPISHGASTVALVISCGGVDLDNPVRIDPIIPEEIVDGSPYEMPIVPEGAGHGTGDLVVWACGYVGGSAVGAPTPESPAVVTIRTSAETTWQNAWLATCGIVGPGALASGTWNPGTETYSLSNINHNPDADLIRPVTLVLRQAGAAPSGPDLSTRFFMAG